MLFERITHLINHYSELSGKKDTIKIINKDRKYVQTIQVIKR